MVIATSTGASLVAAAAFDPDLMQAFVPMTAEQAKYWTFEYPAVATLPMAALVRKVGAMDFSQATVPALFYFSFQDQIVEAAATDGIAEIWGTAGDTWPAIVVNPVLGPQDDPAYHVIAGAIMSPGQTDAAADSILNWIGDL